MNTGYKFIVGLIGALALAGVAYAQVPAGSWTGNDISDGYGNTGMGSGALKPYEVSGGCATDTLYPSRRAILCAAAHLPHYGR
jgi:hypothetical protein